MGTGFRQHRNIPRKSERLPLSTRLHVTTVDGKPVAPLARCTNIGMGGLRGTAALSVAPDTIVLFALEIQPGRIFEGLGHIAWSRMTLHPRLFGTAKGMDDDALFGIAFDAMSTEQRLPIARLIAARHDQRRRAHRIRRMHGLSTYG